jgi:hypothetical protein
MKLGMNIMPSNVTPKFSSVPSSGLSLNINELVYFVQETNSIQKSPSGSTACSQEPAKSESLCNIS